MTLYRLLKPNIETLFSWATADASLSRYYFTTQIPLFISHGSSTRALEGQFVTAPFFIQLRTKELWRVRLKHQLVTNSAFGKHDFAV